MSFPLPRLPSLISVSHFALCYRSLIPLYATGLIVKATDPELKAATKQATSAAASPFVLAIQRANIKGKDGSPVHLVS